MPFLFLAIAVACWVGIIKVMARRGQLTLSDARFGWGCLIYYASFFVWIGLFLLLSQVAGFLVSRFLPSSPYREAANIAGILAIAASLNWFELRILSRRVTYRKLRFIKHWYFGGKR